MWTIEGFYWDQNVKSTNNKRQQAETENTTKDSHFENMPFLCGARTIELSIVLGFPYIEELSRRRSAISR